MLYLAIKAAISGAIVALISEVAKRFPGLGGLIAALPLLSTLGMIWLWRDTRAPDQVAAFSTGAFRFVLLSLPMLLLIPALLKRGIGFWPTLAAGWALTLVLYAASAWIGGRFGLKL